MTMNSKTILASLCALFALTSSFGAVSVTASRDYVDKRTKLSAVTNAEYGVVGYAIGTNTDCVVASTNYVDRKIGEAEPGDYSSVSNAAVNARAKTDLNVYTNGMDGTSATNIATGDRLATTGDVAVAMGSIKTDLITDGTNIIDAAGNVYLMTTGWIASLSASGIASGATSAEIVDKLSLGTPVWGEGVASSGDEPVIGWFVYSGQSVGSYYPDPGTGLYGYEYLGAQDGEDSTVLNISLDYDWDGDGTLVKISGTFKKDGKEKIGKLALTNDIPGQVKIVAPSTNAVAGTAADAKATGTALYTGFTEWEFGDGGTHVITGPFDGAGFWYYELDHTYGDLNEFQTEADALAATSLEFAESQTATRHLVTPTKTSQLTNDGANGVPFAVETQLGTKQDALPYQTNAIPFSVIVGAPSLAGQTFDFSRNYDIIRATAAIAEALGATVTNNPTAGGN